MKKIKSNIEWKISDEKICLAATIMVLALIVVLLSSCKTHKESTVDYQINSSESYQERRAEEHEKQMAIKMAERRDTIKEASTHTGQIEIERDTDGRAVKIIYEHIFNGIQTQGSFRIDTVYQKQVIVLRDSTGNGQKDTVIEGQTKEKENAGINTWGLLGFGGFWLLVCFGVIVLFILIKKRLNQWKG